MDKANRSRFSGVDGDIVICTANGVSYNLILHEASTGDWYVRYKGKKSLICSAKEAETLSYDEFESATEIAIHRFLDWLTDRSHVPN